MDSANPISTPILSSSSPDTTPEFTDPTRYRQVIGSLQYLQITRPDLSFCVNKLAQKMNRPSDADWTVVKRVLRYLKGTTDLDLFFPKSSDLTLRAYSDSDWAGDTTDRCSTGGYCIFLGSCLISWKSAKQRTVARSSTEAEYRALATAAAEIAWVKSLLSEIGFSFSSAPPLFCDNVGATYMSSNPFFHSRMKHLAIDYHFVR